MLTPAIFLLALGTVAGNSVDHRDSQSVGYFPMPGCIFGESCGVAEPPAQYQSYRKAEYKNANSTFYQWYYFYLQSRGDAPDQGDSIALALAVSHTGGNEREGVYVSMSRIPKGGVGHKFYVVERFPLDSWHISDPSEKGVSLDIIVDDHVDFSLRIDPTGQHISLKGNLNHISNRYYVAPKSDSNATLDWDVELSRIYGWYGQDYFEKFDQLSQAGIIQWNTHSHCSQFTGKVSSGSDVLMQNKDLSSKQFRAYGDMNWGEHFPVGPSGTDKPKVYNWGWYYVGRAAEKLEDELSFIAGVGTEYGGFPLGTLVGRFGDFRFNSSEGVHMIEGKVWAGADGKAKGVMTAGTNDGKRIRFGVERSDWRNFTDSMGTAQIPMRQILVAETGNGHLIVMDFRSKETDYNRLIFPTRSYVFSDFEALGVETHVTISRDGGKTNETFVSYDGGLEFGYKV